MNLNDPTVRPELAAQVYTIGWLVVVLVLPVGCIIYDHLRYYKNFKYAVLNETTLPDKPSESFLGLLGMAIIFGGLWPIVLPMVLLGGLFNGFIFLEEKGKSLIIKKLQERVVKANRTLLLTSKDPKLRALGETYPNRNEKKDQ